MCGLFGFCGTVPEQNLLQEIAVLAGTRGPHAHGIAWGEDGKISYRKGEGRIKPSFLDGIRPALLIGHCRLSTSGTYHKMQNNQPIISGDIAVSHNGNILKYADLAKKMNIHLETDCDSEVLCKIAEKYGFDTAIQTASGAPIALLLLQNNTITAYRYRMPLFFLSRESGFYFCSRKFESAEPIPECKIMKFEGGNAEWKSKP